MNAIDPFRFEWDFVDVSYGRFWVGAGPKGIVRVSTRARPGKDHDRPDRYKDALEKATGEIKEYLAGRRRKFSVKVDMSSGTGFQQKVWKELTRIPYGSVRSYGEVARRLGMPRAARAVGQACGRNPVSIIVPCHRVVASNGIGGFGNDIQMKVSLLRLEGVEDY